jgi:hypothetical protein
VNSTRFALMEVCKRNGEGTFVGTQATGETPKVAIRGDRDRTAGFDPLQTFITARQRTVWSAGKRTFRTGLAG